MTFIAKEGVEESPFVVLGGFVRAAAGGRIFREMLSVGNFVTNYGLYSRVSVPTKNVLSGEDKTRQDKTRRWPSFFLQQIDSRIWMYIHRYSPCTNMKENCKTIAKRTSKDKSGGDTLNTPH
jgi:hypothetical protein